MESLAIVTGAGTGIGGATARELAARGHRVALVGRRSGPLEAVRAEIAAGGGAAASVRADVADRAALSAGLAPLGAATVLVANAGLCEAAGLADFEADRVWRRVLATNLDGAWHTARVVAPTMPVGGRVVFIASGLGKVGRAGYAAYCASKHGVLGLMRALALELAPRGVTVNAVCPGWVDTEMAAADLARAATHDRPAALVRDAAERGIPIGRFVSADEVARVVAFLCAPEAAAVTGQAWNACGGEVSA